jgi:hypothetical protein
MEYPNHILKNLSNSASDFLKIVWPAILSEEKIGGGEIIPVEAVSPNDFASELDVLAGIDAWQVVKDNKAVRGIASRVQWGINYRSFSIRYTTPSGVETEFQKRRFALNNPEEGYLFPHLTVQAFLDEPGGQLLSVAAIPTKYLIQQAQRLIEWGRMNDGHDSRFGIRYSPDGKGFIYMSWEYLKHSEINNYIIVLDPDALKHTS